MLQPSETSKLALSCFIYLLNLKMPCKKIYLLDFGILQHYYTLL